MMEGILDKALTQFASISITQFVLMTIVPSIIYTVYLIVHMRTSDDEIAVADVMPVYCFIIYFNIILQLTLMGRTDGSRIGIEMTPFSYLQKDGATYNKSLAITYSALNLLLFVPYGFIVAWLPFFRKQKKTVNFCLSSLISLATSLLVELLQLSLGRGYYELEDLICNTLGGIIGVLFFILVYEYIFPEEGYRN